MKKIDWRRLPRRVTWRATPGTTTLAIPVKADCIGQGVEEGDAILVFVPFTSDRGRLLAFMFYPGQPNHPVDQVGKRSGPLGADALPALRLLGSVVLLHVAKGILHRTAVGEIAHRQL